MRCTLGQSPLFESSLDVKVLEVSMPESLVAESWLVCRSDSHRREAQSCGAPEASRPPRGKVAAPSCPSKRTVFFLLSVKRLLSEESSHK